MSLGVDALGCMHHFIVWLKLCRWRVSCKYSTKLKVVVIQSAL